MEKKVDLWEKDRDGAWERECKSERAWASGKWKSHKLRTGWMPWTTKEVPVDWIKRWQNLLLSFCPTSDGRRKNERKKWMRNSQLEKFDRKIDFFQKHSWSKKFFFSQFWLSESQPALIDFSLDEKSKNNLSTFGAIQLTAKIKWQDRRFFFLDTKDFA